MTTENRVKLPHPWEQGLECRKAAPCSRWGEHSHITNPPWIPRFDRVLIAEVGIGD